MSTPSLRERLFAADTDDKIILSISLAEQLIAEGTDDGFIFEIYARHLIGIGRHDDATAALDRAEQLATKKALPWVIHRRALLEKRRGNLELALDLWMKAFSKKPDEATFLIFASIAANCLGRSHEAEKIARRATTCSEGCVDEAWYDLGGYLAAQERYDEAMVSYDKTHMKKELLRASTKADMDWRFFGSRMGEYDYD